MSDNRKLVSDIRDLDQGITDCENFLAKVLHRKVESTRQSPVNKKKNAPSKLTTRPESRGRSQTRQHTPSMGVTSLKETARTIHPVRKQSSAVGSTKKVPPEPTGKPKSNDGQRKRSVSVSRLASQSCKCDLAKTTTSSKFSHHVHMLQAKQVPSAKSEVTTQVARSRSPELRNNQSWGEILRENHQPVCKHDRGEWDIGTVHCRVPQLPANPFPSFSSKIPHECEPIKECNSHSSGYTPVPTSNHYFKPPTSRHHPTEESFSSEGTSGFSSNNDLPSNLTNKGIQCGSPISRTRPKSGPTDHFVNRRLSSSSSGASSQKAEDKTSKVAGILGSDVFTMFNPVRTLNFLIKELQGMLHKNPKEDASICRIIADMEKVLHRLPETGEGVTEASSGYITHSMKPHGTNSITSSSSQSYDAAEKPLDVDTERTAIIRALESVPALARRIDERTESMRKKIQESRAHVPIPTFAPIPPETDTNCIDGILRLQKHVEISGSQLEMMCRTMEQACEALKNERDVLKVEIEARDKELQIVKSQESDFVTTVTSLRNNLESNTRRATQLSVENKLLKEQVKELPGLKYIQEKYKQLVGENAHMQDENKRLHEKISECNIEIQKLKGDLQNQLGMTEATKRLTQRLQEVMKERDEAQHDLQILRMEREKLLVLSRNKDDELSHFIQDIINIKEMVTNQLYNLKINMPRTYTPISNVLNCSSDSDDITTLTSHFQPICSSPTSTTSGVPPIGDDWQNISTIVPEHTHSSPEILMSAHPKELKETTSATDFKSIERDSWQVLALAGQGEFVRDDIPRRPGTAIPGPRPPLERHIDPSALGDNKWTGASVVTQELHQNVQELFRLINTSSKSGSSSTSATVVSSTNTLSTVPSCRQSGSSRHTTMPDSQIVFSSKQNFHFQMPRLPDPPKFLDTPEFSEISSFTGSLTAASSVESIDAVLKKLHKDDHKK